MAKKQNPVTVTAFCTAGRAMPDGYTPPQPRRAVTVSAMHSLPLPPEIDWGVDLDALPEDGIVLFGPPEVVDKYIRRTIDCRNWVNREVMYDELKAQLGFSDAFRYDLESLADEMAKLPCLLTLIHTKVPFYHMAEYFRRAVWTLSDLHAIDDMFLEDEREYIEDYMEVDFTAGDTPMRPMYNPPYQPVPMPPLDKMW